MWKLRKVFVCLFVSFFLFAIDRNGLVERGILTSWEEKRWLNYFSFSRQQHTESVGQLEVFALDRSMKLTCSDKRDNSMCLGAEKCLHLMEGIINILLKDCFNFLIGMRIKVIL